MISHRPAPALRRPYFAFYPADWLSSVSVACLSPAQEGGYIRLLCYAWDHDGLPDDLSAIARMARLSEDDARALLELFPIHAGDVRRRNQRQEKERHFVDERREHSRKAAESRWKDARAMPEHSPSNAQAMPSQSQSQIPEPEKKKRERAPRAAPSAPVGSLIPPILDTPEFSAAWTDWLAYRAERRLKYMPTSMRAALADLEPYGSAHACSTLRASIKNGWQGLFPEKVQAARSQAGTERSGRSMMFSQAREEPKTVEAEVVS